MPITPYAKLRVSVNGGAPQTGGVVAPASATAQFSFESTVGWTKYRLEMIGPSAWALPSGWTDESGTYVYTGVDTPPPALTLPDATVWGKYMPTLTVNDGLRYGAYDPAMIDTSTAVSVLSTNALEDVGTFETSQFSAKRGWLGALQADLRKLETALAGGGGGGGGGTPSDTAPPAVAAASVEGVSLKFARQDHTHAHGSQTGGSNHSNAVSGGAAGFMSGADKAKLDALTGGVDITIDFRSASRDYLAGTGSGSGSGGDNAQTVPFTITANNGTTVPATLASGLTLTPVLSTNAAILESTVSNGLRAGITSGFGGKLTDLKISITQLGLDRSRPFSLWLLLNRSQFTVPSGSEAGLLLLSNFVSGAPKIILTAEHSAYTPGLTSAVSGYVNGSYTASQFSVTSDSSDDVKVSRFSSTAAEFFTTPSVSGGFPTSPSLATFGRRGRASVDSLLMAPAADGLYIYPNDDDELRLRVRADSTSVTMAYYAMRVVQLP